MSIAIASVAAATVGGMSTEGLIAFRQRRMAELAEKFGGKAELGRKLGYRDGAYVGQMIAGVRPTTEKLIHRAEALPGCAKWFSRPLQPNTDLFDALTDDERLFLDDFRALPDIDREQFAKDIAKRADQMREYLANHLKRAGLPAPKSAAEKAASKARATVDTLRNSAPEKR